ncbi:PAC2 family protein [Micrococcales bacterium 31B]|nr:PAC2 family protein [Micrococcales bacterium 31B]
MLDPDALYEYVIDHGTRIPSGVLLHTFDGFVDAGHAARGVARHLRSHLEHRVVATFDTDQLIDYRERRPTISFHRGHFSQYEQPHLEVLQFFTPSGQSFLVLDGREPALQWERFAAAVIEIVDYLDVEMTVGVGGAPMPVPHTRPLSLIAHANVDDVIELPDLIGQQVEFPASAAAVLEMRLGEAGCPAIGYVAQVPHYAASTVYPQATLALLRKVSDVTGLDIPLDGLADRAAEVQQSIEAQLEGNDEGLAVVHQLEQHFDEYAGGSVRDALAQAVDLPSGEELGAEFQRYLAGNDTKDVEEP